MEVTWTHTPAISSQIVSSPLNALMDKYEQMIEKYWDENPELYRLLQMKKRVAPSVDIAANEVNSTDAIPSQAEDKPTLGGVLRGPRLRALIRESHSEIRQRVLGLNADVIPRTQAHNRKCAYMNIEAERDFRAEVVAAQLQSWRSLLPNLIKKFSRIPDCVFHSNRSVVSL
jgi:hypothetical protein